LVGTFVYQPFEPTRLKEFHMSQNTKSLDVRINLALSNAIGNMKGKSGFHYNLFKLGLSQSSTLSKLQADKDWTTISTEMTAEYEAKLAELQK
jgi:hypothetical protein